VTQKCWNLTSKWRWPPWKRRKNHWPSHKIYGSGFACPNTWHESWIYIYIKYTYIYIYHIYISYI
jgi:hypothetical protein